LGGLIVDLSAAKQLHSQVGRGSVEGAKPKQSIVQPWKKRRLAVVAIQASPRNKNVLHRKARGFTKQKNVLIPADEQRKRGARPEV